MRRICRPGTLTRMLQGVAFGQRRKLNSLLISTESTWTQKSKSSVSNPKPTRRHSNKKAVSRVMSGTTCCISFCHERHTCSCSHFYRHSFLSAGKQTEMSKRSQESSSLVSPTAKARACCLVSRESLSVGQNYSSNPKNPGSIRDSQVWPWEERHEKSGWYSVQHASGTESTRERSMRT